MTLIKQRKFVTLNIVTCSWLLIQSKTNDTGSEWATAPTQMINLSIFACKRLMIINWDCKKHLQIINCFNLGKLQSSAPLWWKKSNLRAKLNFRIIRFIKNTRAQRDKSEDVSLCSVQRQNRIEQFTIVVWNYERLINDDGFIKSPNELTFNRII